jgi:hypothetical protein
MAMTQIVLIVVVIFVGLALPPAVMKKSWKQFPVCLVFSFAGIVVPIFFFDPKWSLVTSAATNELI